jgi:hypothetical protein
MTNRKRPGVRFAAALSLGMLAAYMPMFVKRAHAADNATALRADVMAESARPRAPRFERELFLAQPSLSQATLSPQGRQVAYILDDGHRRSLWLLPAAGGEAIRLLGDTQAQRLSWSPDGRWLFLHSPRQVFALAVAGQTDSGIVTTLRSRRQS